MNLHRPLGATGLSCHPLGFGCYRIADDNPLHAGALAAYLDRGGNLIDTSANYTDGDSETLVGKALRERPRDQVIVVTKGGYIQGRNMELAQQRQFPEVVQYGEGIWHSIHPEFLETQVERSVERLQLDYVDVYLLHNPEYYLEEITHHRRPIAPADHEEFYRRVREAFRFLETQVEKGRIRWYGVSSNNYPLAAAAPAATSVARTLAAAESVSMSHHFRVVQLPMNLYEPGGALEPNNNGKTVLEFCREKGLGVLANRPLNASRQNRLVRLADFLPPGEKAPGAAELEALLTPVGEQEQRLRRELGAALMEGEGIAAALRVIVPQLRSAAHWEQVAGQHVIAPIQRWLTQSRQRFVGRAEWNQWQGGFLPLLNAALQGIHRHLSTTQQLASDLIRGRLVEEAGYPNRGESLSRMALNVLLGLEGLSCVLVGMRRPEYVEDAMGAAEIERVDSPGILRRFAV